MPDDKDPDELLTLDEFASRASLSMAFVRLSAWAEYTELRRELRDKRRPIRFTPAHPKESPRFFIFPKKASAGGKWGSTHQLCTGEAAPVEDTPGMLAFTAGIAIRDGVKWLPVMTRIPSTN